ncbi:MAG: DUF839 domain-containing protein [Chitinophagales bacterium]|nr:DUF839 domain-containing protein [Chitinophagales bacterium]
MKSIFTFLLAISCFIAINAQNIGDFTSVEPDFQDELMHIPSTHAFQLLAQTGDALGDGSVMGPGSDLTAYLPINGSSTHGYLCVNSEWVPGGVAIFEIQLNNTTKLWEILGSKQANFDPFLCNITLPPLLTEPAGTMVNCSGGITPWGTVVTSEEFDDIPTGVCNVRGYKSFGWNVEIDPVTGEAMDYDNDGNKDKVWAMGCFSHENVVFAADSITAYQGEDNSSAGYMFKFVMDNKANLGSGKLYALKLDNNWQTTGKGTWKLIPNTSVNERNGVLSAAAAVGATPFDRVEDVEIGTDGQIYFASTGQNIVFRFTDIDTTIADFEIYVDNIQYSMVTASGTVQALFASPDNLAFDNQGNLWVDQDGGENYKWVIGANHTAQNPNVRIFANTPLDCEPTGTHFTPDGKYMFYSIQHPDSTNTQWQTDAGDRSVVFDKPSTVVVALKENLGDSTTGILGYFEDLGTFKDLSIYPNPVSDVFRIKLNSGVYDFADLRIYDMGGKEMKKARYFLNYGRNELQVDGSKLLKGSYILTLTHAKGTITKTFEK